MLLKIHQLPLTPPYSSRRYRRVSLLSLGAIVWSGADAESGQAVWVLWVAVSKKTLTAQMCPAFELAQCSWQCVKSVAGNNRSDERQC